MSTKVLIIDDEDLFREDLARLLSMHGHECRTAASAEDGVAAAEAFGPDVILCDVVMPGKGGIDILDEIMALCPESFVIMITAYGSLETAVQAFRRGVSDYVMKPFVIEDVIQKIQRLVEHKRLTQETKLLRRQISQASESQEIVGESTPMKQVVELIDEVAPTPSTVLITGESGTGKELVGRAIHAQGRTGSHPFVAINCAGVPEHLFESELFGHVRGSFTGAIEDRQGFFELAGEGTILLDEIGEMPISVQSKLLRVLEQKEFVRVGGARSLSLGARILASTNKNLREFTQQGGFREDLFFRIAVFEIRVPPLRERRLDIPLLAEHFVGAFNKELKRNCPGVSNEAMAALLSHTWPGNVRELRNVIERAMILCRDDYITPELVPSEISQRVEAREHSDDLREAVRAYEKAHILRVIEASGGNKEKAARRLGINPSTLHRKLAELSVDAQRPR